MYLTRHGESLGNQSKSMGGDLSLSQKGDRYASVLADFVAAQPDAGQSRLLVWCSPMRRAAQTARAVSVFFFFFFFMHWGMDGWDGIDRVARVCSRGTYAHGDMFTL